MKGRRKKLEQSSLLPWHFPTKCFRSAIGIKLPNALLLVARKCLQKICNAISKENLEIFSLIWCDSDVDKVYQSRATQEKLLDLIHFQCTFKSIEECEQYIRQQTTPLDKIILISSGSFGQDLLARVHSLPQITTVYIYCLLKTNHTALLTDFSKVNESLILLNILLFYDRFDVLKTMLRP